MGEDGDWEDEDEMARRHLENLRASGTPAPKAANLANVPSPPSDDARRSAQRRVSFGIPGPRSEADNEQLRTEEAGSLTKVLRDQIPDDIKTPKPSGNNNEADRDLWADCDRGVPAQQRLTGAQCSWPAAQRVVFIIMQLVPVKTFAKELYDWNKTKHSTLIKLAATYEHQRSNVTTLLTDATRIAGEEAREKIDQAKQLMFGAEQIHDIAVYALMIYWWACHADSEKKDLIDNVIDEYLRTPDDQTEQLINASEKGQFLTVDDSDYSGVMHLPGMKRLNYLENDRFTRAWLDMWTVCVNLLTHREKSKQDIGDLNRALDEFVIDAREHPDCRQRKPVHMIHSTQRGKTLKIAELAKRNGVPERTPDTYARAVNLMCAVEDPTFRKLEVIIEETDDLDDSRRTKEQCSSASKQSSVRKDSCLRWQ